MPSVHELIGMVGTFLLVVFGWIIFRSENMQQLFDYVKIIFSRSLFASPIHLQLLTVLFVILMFVVEWVERSSDHGLSLEKIKSPLLRVMICYGIFLCIFLCSPGSEEFIYFQF